MTITPKELYNQINDITSDLIGCAISSTQNFPSINKKEKHIIEINPSVNSTYNSIFLKSLSYTEIYEKLNKDKNYNIKTIDGALITLQYRFFKNELLAHRLAFFPNPDLDSFQQDPDTYLEDEIFADIINRRVVAIPLRFDFDKGPTAKPIIHPRSHLTLGQYPDCRIPVSSPLTPYQFISFIVNNFYNCSKLNIKIRNNNKYFDDSLFSEEMNITRIIIGR